MDNERSLPEAFADTTGYIPREICSAVPVRVRERERERSDRVSLENAENATYWMSDTVDELRPVGCIESGFRLLRPLCTVQCVNVLN